jgi:arginine exporter protein ArgO
MMVMATSSYTDIRRSPLRTAALVVGVVFLLVGIMGFIPGLTTDYDEMSGAGHESMAELLGVFQVSVLHNVVHLLFGLLGIVLARTNLNARNYLIGGGVIYLLLWIYGLVIDKTSSANFVPVNSADDWLHLALAVGMIGLGVALGRDLRDGRV